MFTKALVLVGQGADRVFLTTDKPSAFTTYSDPLTLTFEATAGTGAAYVKEHFGLDAIVVDRGGNRKLFKN